MSFWLAQSLHRSSIQPHVVKFSYFTTISVEPPSCCYSHNKEITRLDTSQWPSALFRVRPFYYINTQKHPGFPLPSSGHHDNELCTQFCWNGAKLNHDDSYILTWLPSDFVWSLSFSCFPRRVVESYNKPTFLQRTSNINSSCKSSNALQIDLPLQTLFWMWQTHILSDVLHVVCPAPSPHFG